MNKSTPLNKDEHRDLIKVTEESGLINQGLQYFVDASNYLTPLTGALILCFIELVGLCFGMSSQGSDSVLGLQACSGPSFGKVSAGQSWRR